MYNSRPPISITSNDFALENPQTQYIIFGNDSRKLRESFDRTRNVYSRYIIFASMDDEKLNSLFEYLWSREYFYIVFIVMRSSGEATVRYYRSNDETPDSPHLQITMHCYSNSSNRLPSERLLPQTIACYR